MNDIQRAVARGRASASPSWCRGVHRRLLRARRDRVPQAIGLASTWASPGRARRPGHPPPDARGGARHTLAPVIDLARDPRWGQLEETYGEDPYLCGRIGTAYVRGIQGDDLTEGVIATGKHFLAYGMSEGGMNWAPVHFGPRELREVYAEPFAAAIRDAGLASMMNSYASVDGLPCAASPEILDSLLRDELGFDGVVVADYFSVQLLITHHHVAPDAGHAAALALAAGLDVELPQVDCYGEPLRDMVVNGDVPIGLIDRAVTRVLESKAKLGLFENPYVDAGRAASVRHARHPSWRATRRRRRWCG